MTKEKVILVTGAAGMIGSGVVRYLNDLGHTNLLLVDDLKSGEKWKNLLGKRFINLISKHTLFDWLFSKEGEVDAIIHLGACSDTTESNADYLLENNFRYTIRLAEWALSHNKRFIYASSAATYGDGSLGFKDDESALETLRPLNMYGFSKHLVDLWMKRENVLNRVVGLKYFNVFGPNESHERAHGLDGSQNDAKISRRQRGLSLQIKRSSLCRWRADARFHLFEGCGQNDLRVSRTAVSEHLRSISILGKGYPPAGIYLPTHFLKRLGSGRISATSICRPILLGSIRIILAQTGINSIRSSLLIQSTVQRLRLAGRFANMCRSI